MPAINTKHFGSFIECALRAKTLTAIDGHIPQMAVKSNQRWFTGSSSAVDNGKLQVRSPGLLTVRHALGGPTGSVNGETVQDVMLGAGERLGNELPASQWSG